MERKKPELLAPAGNPQAFYGAVSAGADAVYLGGQKYGARAYAENFTEDELIECIGFGRMYGVKVYLTVNTLFKEQELEELPDFIDPLYRAGLNGVIIQDLGALGVIRRSFPELELHASTQMTLCTEYGAGLLKTMGVKRIVPARELGIDELARLKSRTGLEIEAFIHGAMCYCYSGQCLFSSILGGRSGNRGRCAQPCRLPYRVGKGKVCYPLSMKDMCSIENLPAILNIGIDSLKIEGRMKKPEYVAGVTACYRKYIDRYLELVEKYGDGAGETYEVEEEDIKFLSSLYVRGSLSEGYLYRKNGREMISVGQPAYRETDEELLRVIRSKYLERRPAIAVDMEAEFKVGNPAVVVMRRNGIEAKVSGNVVERALSRPITEENIISRLKKLGDTPFEAENIKITVSPDAFYPLKDINELRRRAQENLQDMLLNKALSAGVNKSICTDANKTLSAYENKSICTDANKALSADENKSQCADDGEKNEKCAQQKGTNTHRPTWSISAAKNRPYQSTNISSEFSVCVRTYEQLCALADFLRDNRTFTPLRVYVDCGLLFLSRDECPDKLREIASTCNAENVGVMPQFMAALPYVMRHGAENELKELCRLADGGVIHGFLVRSFDELGFLSRELSRRHDKSSFSLRGDAGLYAWNTEAVKTYASYLEGLCIPFELNGAQQRELIDRAFNVMPEISWEKVVYGRIPMMVTANCLQKTTAGCRADGEDILWLEDRFRVRFPVLRDCRRCLNVIYNSVPLSMAADCETLHGAATARFDFTLESGDETKMILKEYAQGKMFSGPHTSGHEKRGVE